LVFKVVADASRCADGLVVETTKWEWWNAEEELDRRIKQETDSREGG
jgi:hypothetical protein